MADMSEYDELLRKEREGTSFQLPSLLPPELQASGEDPLEGVGFGELTKEQKKRAKEERDLASNIRYRGIAQDIQDTGEQMSYAGLAPTPSGQVTGFVGDALFTAGAGARYAMGSEGAGADVIAGGIGLALPLIPISIFKKATEKLAEHKGEKAYEAAQNLYLKAHESVKAGKITGEEAAKKLKPELDRLADEAEAQAAKRQKVAAENVEADVAYGKMSRKNAAQAGKKTWLERNMPEDALESLRASPDTQAAKQARSRAQEIQNLVAGGKITPDAGVKLLQTEMRAYASRSDELAGDVMLKKRQAAERATRSRKRGKPPESSLATSEGSDRALKAEQQRAAQETTERQPLEYEKTLYTTDDRGKIIGARKLKPGARLRLEARRKAHRELPAKIRAETPEPRLTPDDYEPVVTKPEYDYQRRIREYDEFEAARKGLREAADTTRDPSLGRLITKSGERMSDQAAVRAQEKAARAAFDRRPNFNDAEFAFLQAKGEVDSSSLDKARDFIYRLRRDKKTLIQTDDGGFDYMDESGLIGGADMPEVDRKFLKSLKEFKREPRGPVPRAPTRGPKSVKVDREALKSRRRAQLAEAQPKPSGPISSGAMMDSYPSMSDREVAENARELRRVFRDDPDVLKEIDGIILGLRSSPSVR